LLSDEKQEVLVRYGLRTKDGYSTPGTYLVGKDGVIRSEFFLEDYKDRVTNDELLRAAAEM
jgi:peroxiredoxin